MLPQLGLRQKLTALAALPMVAVLLTMAPFIVERAQDAGLAKATADAANTARDVGALIQDLQQERLLSLAFLTSRQLDRTAFVAQTATSTADLSRLQGSPATARVVNRAARSLTNLDAIRILTMSRGISAETAYQAYRRTITDLIDDLSLTNPPGVDTVGVTQLQALDELTRANEEASSVGATLVAVAGDQHFPLDLVNQAVTAQAQHTERLGSLVAADQAQLLSLVQEGKAGDRINQLVATVNLGNPGATDLTVADALSAAVSYTTLREVAQDRITRDVARAASQRATRSRQVAVGVGVLGLILLLLVFWLARIISRSISRPIRRLTDAATEVAGLAERQLQRIADADTDDPAGIELPDVDISSPDEIGELAGAFNRVQATAAALVEQQVNSRRNVAVMFANIARRTQNLVGRQRTQMQTLRRYVTDPRATEQLSRLDLQRTQLRRTADSLLVVSGIVDQGAGDTPALLADLIAGVTADLGPDAQIQVRMVVPVAVTAGFVEDLRLILGELLANAVNFSPPGTFVELSAELRDDLTISVMDHGLGLTTARLAEENRRLVDRERLDVAPTSVLGLFVVGRLARRHDLTVSLAATPGGGVTALVRVPAHLLGPASVVDVVRRPSVPAPAGLPAVSDRRGLFDWFGLAARTAELPALPPAWPPMTSLPAGSPARELPAGRPVALPSGPVTQPAATPPRPAPAQRAAAQPAAPKPAESPVAASGTTPDHGNGAGTGEQRGGLTRRRPGRHMAPGLLPGQVTPPAPPAREHLRDPESERSQLESLFSGFQRGETHRQPPVPSEPTVERPS